MQNRFLKDKLTKLANKTESDKPGINIYVYLGRKNASKTEEQVKIAKNYLLLIKQ